MASTISIHPRRVLTSFTQTLRERRFARFLNTFCPCGDCTILDVGGTSAMWLGSGLEKNVTLLNINQPKPRDLEMGFRAVKGNALDMHMFADRQFDIVFSNSVIEHMGTYENQKQFAAEVQRVGRRYWVQTPNRYFPVEPHFLFPFFQFMPAGLQKPISVRWPYSHYKRYRVSKVKMLRELSRIRLLSEREFNGLFHRANLFREELFGLTKSFVAHC